MSRRWRARSCVGALAISLVLSTPSHAADGASTTVPLAWDRNPEPQVIGYIVYVGLAPEQYGESYDVGNATSFVYSRPNDGRRYYFAVAAYSSGPVIGPRSAPISHVSGATMTAAAAPSPPASSRTTEEPGADRTRDTPRPPAVACLDEAPLDCFTVRSLLRTTSDVAALAALPDGRLLIVADRTTVFIHDGHGAPRAALQVTGRTVTGVAVDPLFSRTHFVYVAEVEREGGDADGLTIVRYREVQGTLAEPAVLVTGLQLPANRVAPLTTGGDGNLYVSVPGGIGAEPQGGIDAYAGTVLSFGPDGRVPAGARRMTPVLSPGLAAPRALAWDADAHGVWTTGTDATGTPRIAYLAAPADGDASTQRLTEASLAAPPGPSMTSSLASARPARVLLVSAGGHIVACQSPREPGACTAVLGFEKDQVAIAVAPGRAGLTYVALRHTSGIYELLELASIATRR